MMQGFYLLAMQRARRRARILLGVCALALVCAFYAARVCIAPQAAAASAVQAGPYTAFVEDGRLAVSQGGETVLRTGIDVRSLPQSDREALSRGVVLPDAAALARLLEDYGS